MLQHPYLTCEFRLAECHDTSSTPLSPKDKSRASTDSVSSEERKSYKSSKNKSAINDDRELQFLEIALLSHVTGRLKHEISQNKGLF